MRKSLGFNNKKQRAGKNIEKWYAVTTINMFYRKFMTLSDVFIVIKTNF